MGEQTEKLRKYPQKPRVSQKRHVNDKMATFRTTNWLTIVHLACQMKYLDITISHLSRIQDMSIGTVTCKVSHLAQVPSQTPSFKTWTCSKARPRTQMVSRTPLNSMLT